MCLTPGPLQVLRYLPILTPQFITATVALNLMCNLAHALSLYLITDPSVISFRQQ